MLDTIKKHKNKILKLTITTIIILFFIEIVIFQIFVINTLKDLEKDLENHNHILDSGAYLTLKDLTGENKDFRCFSENLKIKYSGFKLKNGNTIIEATVLNTSSITVSGLYFIIDSKTFKPDLETWNKEREYYNKSDFNDNKICLDGKKLLEVPDLSVDIEPGKAKKIKFTIENHIITKNEILHIQGGGQRAKYYTIN